MKGGIRAGAGRKRYRESSLPEKEYTMPLKKSRPKGRPGAEVLEDSGDDKNPNLEDSPEKQEEKKLLEQAQPVGVVFRCPSNQYTILVDRESPVSSFDNFFQFAADLQRKSVNWERAHACDGVLESKFSSLTEFQRSVYFFLLFRMKEYVQRIRAAPGDSILDNLGLDWVWNWHVWHRNLLKLAKEVVNEGTFDPTVCWKHSEVTYKDPTRRKDFCVQRGYFETRRAPNSKQVNKDWWSYSPTGKTENVNFKTTAATMTLVLLRGPPPVEAGRKMDTSHLCYHFPNRCVNPLHVCWESNGDNQDRRSCINGSAAGCPHRPRCRFVDTEGNPLVCRNNPRAKGCVCGKKCLSYPISIMNHTGEKNKDRREQAAQKLRAGGD